MNIKEIKDRIDLVINKLGNERANELFHKGYSLERMEKEVADLILLERQDEL